MIYPSMVVYEMGIWDHVVAAILCVFAPVLALISRRMTTEDVELDPEDKIKLYHSNAFLLAVFALVVTTVWRIPGRPVIGLGFSWPEWNPQIMPLLIFIFLFYSLDLFFQYGRRTWRIKTFNQRNSTLMFIPVNNRELLHFLFLAVAAGVGEEIIFRGYLIHYIVFWTGNDLAGIITACFFSSSLFAFLHGYQGFRAMLKIFFLSFIFAAIFVLSKSLFIVMVIHTVIDMMSGWLGIYIQRNMSPDENTNQES